MPLIMKLRGLASIKVKIVALAVLAGAVSLTTTARSEDLDPITKWRREIELQNKADRYLREQRFNAGMLQREVDKLEKRKSQLEDELSYVQIKFQGALKQLKAARELHSAVEMQDKFEREADAWDVRRKSVENDLKKVAEDLKKNGL